MKNITDLYKRLDKIFVEHTTHQWKNGWEHEGDRLSKERTIQKNVRWNNLFLLQYYGTELELDGPQGFKLYVKLESSIKDNWKIRIDIESKEMGDIDIYYHINNELDWLAHTDFIVDLCQKVYDGNVKLRESILVVPNNIYGLNNPQFAKNFLRERKLNELGI